jgi:hypothetical protein
VLSATGDLLLAAAPPSWEHLGQATSADSRLFPRASPAWRLDPSRGPREGVVCVFLRRQGEARRSTPFQPPRRRLGEYKVRQGDAISVKNERKKGKVKRKKIRRGLARRPGCPGKKDTGVE